MKSKLLNEGAERTFLLVFETGDSVVDELQNFADTKSLTGSHFTAIGALSEVTVGWFNWQTKKYETAAEISEQVEVLSLIGDIAMDQGKPKIHAHLVFRKRDGSACGGHLIKARVRPTLEVILTESPKQLQRQMDPESGIALIRV
jgi:predicted DNA-binding protein with PD1-like motif